MSLLLLGSGNAGGAAGPALWTPDQLGSALVSWHKGDSLSGSDGDLISTWTDSSGNSRDGSSSGANRPALRTAALNSLNVVEFDAITTGADYFTLPNFMSAFTAGTVIFVAKIDLDAPGGSGSSGPPIKAGTSGSSDHYPFTDGTIYFGYGSDTRKTVVNPTTSLATWHLGCFRSASSDWKYFLNGVQEFTTGTNTVAFTTAPIIGAYNTGIGPYFDGRIAELVQTNTAVGSTDREKLEGYLAHKWGITSVLDAGHPYKSSAPTLELIKPAGLVVPQRRIIVPTRRIVRPAACGFKHAA